MNDQLQSDPAGSDPGPVPSSACSPAGPGDDLERRLRELLPTLVLSDRDLELDGAPVADLVGQADGRLVLVLLVDGEGDGPALAALDALATSRRDGELVAAHLGLTLRGRRPPLVLLVADRFGERLRERLRAISPERLWLLERRSIRTQRRDVWPLVRRAAGEERPLEVGAEGTERGGGPGAVAHFLAQLPPPLARLGRVLVERLARIDPELELGRQGAVLGGHEGLAWSFRGRPLCGVVLREGRLEGRLPGSSIPHQILAQSSIDTFLEWVLTCHLELMDDGREREALDQVELVPSRREPLLTPEEIEAFRE